MSVAQVERVMRASKIDEPFRLTAALTDGQRIFAIRYASDDRPPSLYWCGKDDRLMIVSEPLDAEAHQWNDVPAGHVLVADRDVRTAPFLPGVRAPELALSE